MSHRLLCGAALVGAFCASALAETPSLPSTPVAVTRVLVAPGDAVEGGQPLVTIA